MPRSGDKFDQFEILEPLGAGGMGEVFLARDTELDRKVALKTLAPMLTGDDTARQRFIREAKLAAALDHPYICKIYEVGEAVGRAYIAMEYVGGQTLQDKLASGPMALSEVLLYGSEISEAIEAAHAKNIIHRDLKSPNIMVTSDGHVKVLDFGIALHAETNEGHSRVETLSHRLSSQGTTPGTVVYMSPEQVRGETLDARSDIFALGVVLYEMATAKLPFQGATSGLTYDAILNRGPVPPSQVNPDTPSELERIVLKALEKDRDERYQSVEELRVDLRRLGRDTGAGVLPAATTVPMRKPANRGLAMAFVALLVVSGLMGYLLWPRGGGEFDSLAVLPFENTRNDPEVDYLSDGIPESLINRLSQHSSLHVMARSTAFRYRASSLDPQSIGRELGVGAVLTGRVVQQDDVLNVQAELVDVATGRQLWGEQFSRPLEDLTAIRNEIAGEISRTLRLELAGNEARYTTDAEAYQAYLRGRFLWNKRTNEDFKKAIAFFEQAIERDPNYALAYVGLADCYSLLGGQFYGVDEQYPPRAANQRAREAAEKALSIDEGLAAAHATLAWIDMLDEWDFEKGERGFQRAIALDPDYVTAHQWYGYYLSLRGRHDEAIHQARITVELDPGSPLHNRTLGHLLLLARRYDAAIEQLRKTLELEAGFPLVRNFLIDAYWVNGKRDEAVAVAREQDVGYGDFLSLIAEGDVEEARSLLEARDFAETGLINAVRYPALLGDREGVVAVLEEAFAQHLSSLPNVLDYPLLDALGPEPRLEELRRRVGLSP